MSASHLFATKSRTSPDFGFGAKTGSDLRWFPKHKTRWKVVICDQACEIDWHTLPVGATFQIRVLHRNLVINHSRSQRRRAWGNIRQLE
jgi:hypothetical protein